MDFVLNKSNIKDENILEKIREKINFDEFDRKLEYDIDIDFYNEDLDNDKINKYVSLEIKKEHICFVKTVRRLFEEENIKINEINLTGANTGIGLGEINFEIYRSKYQDLKRNDIIPCKEVIIYEDGKKTLDFMLKTNQISMEEYKINMDILEEELRIDDTDDDSQGYIN